MESKSTSSTAAAGEIICTCVLYVGTLDILRYLGIWVALILSFKLFSCMASFSRLCFFLLFFLHIASNKRVEVRNKAIIYLRNLVLSG